MRKLLTCLAALFGASAALAQNLPSPVFKNLTVNGTITAPEFPNLSSNVEGTGVPGLDGGHWFVWNQPGGFDANSNLRVSRGVQSGSGTSGATYHSLWVTDWNQSTTNAGYEWAFLSEEHNFANASTGAQNVANVGYMFKEIPLNTVATTGASGTGSTATITFSGGATIPVGYSVLIAGVTPSGYNGVYKVTASAAGSVSFASAATGAQTVAGTIVNTSVGASWGANFSCEDKTSEGDPVASCIGAEIDVTAGSATTDANRQRVGLQIAPQGPTGSHIGRGVLLGTNGGVIVDRGFEINGSYGIGMDFTGSTFTTAPVFLAQGQKIVFDGTAAGTYNWALSDMSGTMALRYGPTYGFTLDQSGNLGATGSISSAANVSAVGSVTAGANVNLAQGNALTLDYSAGSYNWAFSDVSGVIALQYGGSNKFTVDTTGLVNAPGGFSTGGTGKAGSWNATAYFQSNGAGRFTTLGTGLATLAFGAGSYTYTFPQASDTIATLGATQTWTGANTFASLFGPASAQFNINSASGQVLAIGSGGNPWVFDTSNYFRPTTDNTLQIGASSQRVGAGFFTNLGSSATPITTANANAVSSGTGSSLALSAPGCQNVTIGVNGATPWIFGCTGSFNADGDNTRTLGSSTARWSTGYFVNLGASATPVAKVYVTQLLSTSALPTISTCGTSPPAATAGSSSHGGQFTLGTGSTTACTVTFSTPFPTYAYCTVTPASAYTGTYYISAQSAAAFTVTLGAGTASVKFNYSCSGN